LRRGRLGCLGLDIGFENVVDTLQLPRQLRTSAQGGHSLKAVCERELGLVLDKNRQTSDWTRRPLTAQQKRRMADFSGLLIFTLLPAI